MNDSNGKEMVPLNSTRPMDLSEFKRGSKMSNLEATNQVKLDLISLFLQNFNLTHFIIFFFLEGPSHVTSSSGFVHAQR